jgi:hypothetical protein
LLGIGKGLIDAVGTFNLRRVLREVSSLTQNIDRGVSNGQDDLTDFLIGGTGEMVEDRNALT